MSRLCRNKWILALLMVLVSNVAWAVFSSPLATMEEYRSAVQSLDFRAADACYTAEGQARIASAHYRNAAQLQRVAQLLKDREFKLKSVSKTRALVTVNPVNKMLPPFPLRKEGQSWKIDLPFMIDNVVYDSKGWNWKDPKAFKDWTKGS